MSKNRISNVDVARVQSCAIPHEAVVDAMGKRKLSSSTHRGHTKRRKDNVNAGYKATGEKEKALIVYREKKYNLCSDIGIVRITIEL